MSRHRKGVNLGFLARHNLSLSNLNQSRSERILADINLMPGVDKVRIDLGKSRIKLAYDASQHNLDEILGVIHKHQVSLTESWWNRRKLNWARQTDSNIKANSQHEPHCCNKMPRK